MTLSDFTIEPLGSPRWSSSDEGAYRDQAAELAALHIRVWREAYAGMLSQDYLDGMQLEPRISRWRQRIQLSDAQESRVEPDGVLRIARLARHTSTGRIAGMCSVGAARDDDPPLAQELSSLNVLGRFHGTGAAQQLVAATLGDRPAYLWVVDQNLRAQAFYRKLGFLPDGGTKHDDRLECDEIRMVRRSVAADGR